MKSILLLMLLYITACSSTALQEARIILPKTDNSGKPIPSLHQELRQQLIEHFGGYTAIPGEGGWLNEKREAMQEKVWVYNVAMTPTAANCRILQNIGQEIGRKAAQQAVYVRCAGNEVQLIPLPPLPLPPPAPESPSANSE